MNVNPMTDNAYVYSGFGVKTDIEHPLTMNQINLEFLDMLF